MLCKLKSVIIATAGELRELSEYDESLPVPNTNIEKSLKHLLNPKILSHNMKVCCRSTKQFDIRKCFISVIFPYQQCSNITNKTSLSFTFLIKEESISL